MKELPENYKLILSLDLQNNKKQFWIVNILSFLIMIPMLIIGHLYTSIFNLFNNPVQMIFLGIGVIVYMVLHEMVHGIFMYYYSKEKPFFGFTGAYAYAGSNCYYYKKPYLIIALSPIVILGIIIFILNIILPEYFWIIYFIQVANISGAAGDLYVTYKFMKLNDNVLVKDIGISMDVYGVKNDSEIV